MKNVSVNAERNPRLNIVPMPAAVDTEIRRAYETLVSARRLRRYAERLIGQHIDGGAGSQPAAAS